MRDGDFLCTIDEFFKASCKECKDKCRKKPKHYDLMKEYIKEYKWYLDWRRKNCKELKPSPFHKWVAPQIRHSKEIYTDDGYDF